MTETSLTPRPGRLAALFDLQAGLGRGNRPAPGAGASGQPGERLLGKRVLIVEDQALLALELQFAFEDEGAEVLGPLLSLAAARQRVADDDEIDFAVLDVDLGGEDVYPVAALLQKRGVPFLFHTGHGTAAELHALFPGTVTCIKPTLPGALIAQMLRLI